VAIEDDLRPFDFAGACALADLVLVLPQAGVDGARAKKNRQRV